MPNICEYEGVDEASVNAKHDSEEPVVRVLMLSSLIDTKGYPEYLEALEDMSIHTDIRIRATLCGPLTITPYSERFTSIVSARAWIDDKVKAINASNNIQVEWIEGARGKVKQVLFEQAQIFVLPSRYKVEAQPLAVIEAMSWGCAIVTSAVGELPSTVDETSAIILPSPDSVSVCHAVKQLCEDTSFRKNLGLGALRRFNQKFSRNLYIKSWKDLLFRDTEN
ncbi:glycosyltransferase family 4 protein [bacterium]|nr:glycosyltransferase family 4 protein [bacterium]